MPPSKKIPFLFPPLASVIPSIKCYNNNYGKLTGKLLHKGTSPMNKKKTIAWGAVIAWMALIFFLSHQPADVSSSMSSGIAEKIKAVIETTAPAAGIDADFLHTFVRKNAHFFAYLILGTLAFYAMRQSGVLGMRGALLAFTIAVLYAVSDETHQLFIPGRSGEARDVLIDSAGAGAGIGLYFLTARIRRLAGISARRDRLQETNE